MSGRLVLLPKKSYTPWNPKNVERVLKDEALARQEQEKELRAIREIEARNRLKKLKGFKSGEDGESDKHINLFQREESNLAMEKKRRLEQEEEVGTKRHPSSRVFLHRTDDNCNVAPFYMTAPLQQQQYGLTDTADRNNMSFHDPMKRFYYQPTDETGYETKRKSNDTTLSTTYLNVAGGIPREKTPLDDHSSSSSIYAKKKKKKRKKAKHLNRSRRMHRKRSSSPKIQKKSASEDL